MVQHIDQTFAAIADPTRRGILQRLAQRDASITELALCFDMTLTGMKKHVRVLEDACLVATQKIGRVRTCRLGTNRMTEGAEWIRQYQRELEARLDRLAAFLEQPDGDTP